MVSKCKKCGCDNLKIDKTYPYHDIYECFICKHTVYQRLDDCCRSPYPIVTIHRYDHNRYSLCYQCINCGGADKNKQLKSKDFSELIRDEFNNCKFNDWKVLKEKERKLINESIVQGNYTNTNYYQYRSYLESDEWRAKRILVLRRDNNLCQQCRTEQATEVHHLTYDHVLNEPLEDLQSLCRACHAKIHDKPTLKMQIVN